MKNFPKITLFISSMILVIMLIAITILTIQYRSDIKQIRNQVLEGSKLAETSKGTVEYSITGDGLPVLYVHGTGGGYDMGLLFTELLGDDYQWICPSRFGYLRTPLQEDSSFEAQADQYAALLDYLGIEKTAIIGLSAGGASAIQFALRYPERCEALILQNSVSMTVKEPYDTNSFYTWLFKDDYRYWLVSRLFKNTLYKNFGVDPKLISHLPEADRKWVANALNVFHPASLRYPGIINDMESIVSEQQYPLDEIKVPTLILHTTDDLLVPYSYAEYANENIPNSKLVTFPTGGHVLIGQFDKYKQEVNDFLNQYMKSTEDK